MKKILITGGAGFIGLKLSTQLLCEPDCQITVVDNLLPQVHGPQAKMPSELQNPRICFFQRDITDVESLEKIVTDADPDVVYHLASETGTGQSYDEVTRYSRVNVLGTAILLQILRNKAPHLQKVILTSSRAVYGEGCYLNQNLGRVFPRARSLKDLQLGQFFPRIESEILTRPTASLETDPVSPASIYASTKLMQEYLVTQALAGSQIKSLILRFQNVYGPGQSLTNPYTGVLSIFCKQILNGQTLNIFEDGEIIRDFIYVSDVVQALCLSMVQELPSGIILNIGSGEPTSILSVAKALMSIFGAPDDRLFVSGNFRIGDIRHALADTALAQQTIGWKAQVSLSEGLSRLVHSTFLGDHNLVGSNHH